MTGLSSSCCGACKFLRRKCNNQCVFAPFFSYDESTSHFAAVHKVFGASNVSKLLLHLPLHIRSHAAVTIAYEALERMRDPTYGCIAHIFALQHEVASLQEEIEFLGSQIANFVAGNGSVATVENPFIELQVSQQLDDLATNKNDNQNDLFSQLPHQTFDQVLQNDAEMISPMFCFEDEEKGFFGCNYPNNNVMERSAFDVSFEESFVCPW